jgi:hypothetical protein
LRIAKQIILSSPNTPQSLMRFSSIANLLGEKGVFLLEKR